MKENCKNCHFLAKEYREDMTGRVLSWSLSAPERSNVQADTEHAVPEHYSLKCYMGVWDDGVSRAVGERNVLLNRSTRNNSCFFLPHNPAMLFEAARELQKSKEENRQLKKSNMYTRLGLWIAAIGIFANAVSRYIAP